MTPNPNPHKTTRRVILSAEGPALGTLGVEGPRRRQTSLYCPKLSTLYSRTPSLRRAAIGTLLVLGIDPQTTQAQSTRLVLPETDSTITLSFTPDKDRPGDFRSILIRSGSATTRIVPKHSILRIPATREARKAAYIWSADTPGLKSDPSRYFLVGEYTEETKPHTLLVFLSEPYASDAAPLLIIAFSDAGKPYKFFEREYELTALEQADSGAFLIGKETISQAMCDPSDPHAPSSTTYDPYSVFAIHSGSKPVYLLDASRDYNRKHYVWAGPKSREDYAVIYNLPGHPKIYGVPVAQHNKLMSQLQCTP